MWGNVSIATPKDLRMRKLENCCLGASRPFSILATTIMDADDRGILYNTSVIALWSHSRHKTQVLHMLQVSGYTRPEGIYTRDEIPGTFRITRLMSPLTGIAASIFKTGAIVNYCLNENPSVPLHLCSRSVINVLWPVAGRHPQCLE